MPDELRVGEQIVQSAGGRCSVCKGAIAPGPAVQLSKYTSRIRHLACVPKKDTRRQRLTDVQAFQWSGTTTDGKVVIDVKES